MADDRSFTCWQKWQYLLCFPSSSSSLGLLARQGWGRVSTLPDKEKHPKCLAVNRYLSLSAFTGDCGDAPLDSCLDDVSDPSIDDS
jgi:hypothetical protein